MAYDLPEGRFKLLEWEDMDGGAWRRLYVSDEEAGHVCLACMVEPNGDGSASASIWNNVDSYEADLKFFASDDAERDAMSWCEERAVSLLEEGVGWAPGAGPSPEAVARGFAAGVARLGSAPGAGQDGTVCWIGDNWFFFDTPDADGMTPEEYVAAKGEERVVELVAGALSAFREDDPDEYEYYAAVLRGAGCL